MGAMAPAHDDAHRSRLGSVFGTVVDADRYDQLRPEYPPEAVDWLLGSPAGPLRVLDLAAGTGKVSRVLAALGHDVVAVDPSGPMLDALRRSLAGAAGGERVEALTGSAEDVPLGDGSVDAVVVGQAWHWMRPAAALAEVHRVLRPGGVLGLAWNVRDLRTPWAADLERLLRGETGRGPADSSDRDGHDERGAHDEHGVDDVAVTGWWPRVPAPAGPGERAAFPAQQLLAGVQDVVDLAATHSRVAVSEERDALLRRVRELAAAAAAPDGSVVVPTVCRCFRYRLP